MIKSITFVGPSLLDKENYPIRNNVFMPPAKCGDILYAMRLNPKVIGLIDGYFDQVPAVWHKEILYALSKGIKIVGGASMGALRAAELAAYGMIKCGKIVEEYYLDHIISDEEVALQHASSEDQFRSMTLPLVNLRFTLQNAVKDQMITQDQMISLLALFHSIYYKDRTLNTIIKKLEAYSSTIAEKIIPYLKYRYIDQKRLDAIAVLDEIKKLQTEKQDFHFDSLPNITTYFHYVIRDVSCSPFPYFFDWLPLVEKKCIQIKKCRVLHILIKTLALMIYMLERMSLPISTDKISIDNCLLEEAQNYFHQFSQDVTNKRYKKPIQVANGIIHSIWEHSESVTDNTLVVYRKYVELFVKMNLGGLFENELIDFQDCIVNLKELISRAWVVFDLLIPLEKFSVSSLLTEPLTRKIESDSIKDFDKKTFVISAARLKFIVINGNTDVLGIDNCPNDMVWYLMVSIMSGVYKKILSC